MPDGTDTDKEKERGLPPDFYTGLNYLGKPAKVSVQGESPTASAAGATPTGALGVGPTATGGVSKGTAAGATGGTPSSSSAIQTALEALGLTKNVADVASGVSKTDKTNTGTETSAGGDLLQGEKDFLKNLNFDPGPGATVLPLPGSFPGQVEIGTGKPVTSGVATGAEAAGTTSDTGTAAASDVGSSASPAAAAAAAAQAAAQLAGAKIPKPVTSGEAALNVGPSGLPTAIGEIVTKGKPSVLDVGGLATGLSGITSGIESFFGFGGKPPAISFPGSTWQQISSQVSAALPAPLTVPTGATPEQARIITDFNTMVQGVRDRYGSPNLPAWVTAAGPQSVETWNNVLPMMTKEVQMLFDNLSASYPKVAQAMKDASTPAPTTKKAAPTTQVLPGSFYGGSAGATPDKTQKLPEAGQ